MSELLYSTTDERQIGSTEQTTSNQENEFEPDGVFSKVKNKLRLAFAVVEF